jgi:hypothetical protein
VEQLEGDGALVPQVARQKDRRHAAPAELALDRVASAKGVFQGGWDGHDGS